LWSQKIYGITGDSWSEMSFVKSKARPTKKSRKVAKEDPASEPVPNNQDSNTRQRTSVMNVAARPSDAELVSTSGDEEGDDYDEVLSESDDE
jgi:hypothetical protein